MVAPLDNREHNAERRTLAWLALTFVAVHAAFYCAGGHFVSSTLAQMMHFADPELLRTRLIETCFYFHIQPPLMNFFSGLILKLPEPLVRVAFHAALVGFGFVLYISTYLLQRRLGVSRRCAAVLCTAFMISPSFLLYEHWLFYTLPCAALLAAAAVLWYDVLEGKRVWAATGLFGVVFLLCGTCSMFHLLYFGAVLLAAVLIGKGQRKRVLLAAAIPFLLVLAVYVKNYVVFGEFTACTFAGKNLWITTAGNMGWRDREALIAAGKLSPLSRINRWSSMPEYPAEYRVLGKFADIPVLSQIHKSTGAPNYNHFGEIAVCAQYGRDARYVLTHEPKNFLAAVALAGYRYFRSSDDLPLSVNNTRVLWALKLAYDCAVYGKVPLPGGGPAIVQRGGPPYLLLIAGLLASFVYGVYIGLRGRSGARKLTPAQRGTVVFVCFNILYVAVLGCTFDILETSRYRFMTDGLSQALLALLISAICIRRMPRVS